MMLATQTRSDGWIELCQSLGAKYNKVDIPKVQAEMRTIPESEYQPAIVALVETLKRQSSISEPELVAALTACFLLARDGKRSIFTERDRERERGNLEWGRRTYGFELKSSGT